MELVRLIRRLGHFLAHEGVVSTAKVSIGKAKELATYPVVKRLRASATFRLAGREHHYFIHHYNSTWRNERAVEVALASDLLRPFPPRDRYLEVGNVLNYYLDAPHIVVDKYEPSPDIINQDVLDYGTPGSFDLVVSISTLEHVGWDETPRDPGKVKRALDHLKSLRTPTGKFFLSFPLGYNPALDQIVRERALGMRETWYFKRVSADNRWQEVALDDAIDAKYGEPYPAANGLVVALDY